MSEYGERRAPSLRDAVRVQDLDPHRRDNLCWRFSRRRFLALVADLYVCAPRCFCRKMPPAQQSGLQQSGITIKDVDAHEFVKRYAIHLKKQGKISLPELARDRGLHEVHELRERDLALLLEVGGVALHELEADDSSEEADDPRSATLALPRRP